MKKLYITPGYGHLGETIDTLRKEGHEVVVVGYKYPPIFVKANQDKHAEIRELAKKVDEQVKFRDYRIDEDKDEVIAEFRKILSSRFDEEDLRKLYFNLGFDPKKLPRGHIEKIVKTVDDCSRVDRIADLVEEVSKMRPQFCPPVTTRPDSDFPWNRDM